MFSGGPPPLLRAPDWLTQHISGSPDEPARKTVTRHAEPWILEDIRSALQHLDADSYQNWIDMGLACKTLGDDGYWIWCEWARTSTKYLEHVQRKRWHSFNPERINYETIFFRAQLAGWKNPRAGSSVSPAVLPNDDELLLDMAQLRAAAGEVRWLIKYLLPADSVGLAFGASGTFKSFIILDLALHVAHGLTWCGRKTIKSPVVYLAGEGGAGVWNRIDAWHRAHGLEMPENFRVCKVPLLLDQAQQSVLLKRAIASLPFAPRLIVIDTQSQTFSGDENAATEVAGYYRRLSSDLREPTGATVLVIHHTGHSVLERPRGSSAIIANNDFVLSIVRESEEGMSSRVEVTKQKDGDKVAPLGFVLERHVLGQDSDGDEVSSLVASFHDSAGAIIETAKERLNAEEAAIVSAFGSLTEIPDQFLRDAVYALNPTALKPTRNKAYNRAIRNMVAKGVIELSAMGVWMLKK